MFTSLKYHAVVSAAAALVGAGVAALAGAALLGVAKIAAITFVAAMAICAIIDGIYALVQDADFSILSRMPT